MRLLGFLAVGLFMSGTISGQALADDKDDTDNRPRELIECAPGKDFAKMVRKIGELGPEKRDTINPTPRFSVNPTDGGAMPDRIFARTESGESDFVIGEDGELTDFLLSFPSEKSAEFCVEDQARVGMPKEPRPYEFSMSFNVKFLNSSGQYTMAELEDGLKDGKSVIKKIVPGPVSLFIPKMTHVMVAYDEATTVPEFQAIKSEAVLGDVEYVKAGTAYLIAYETLETMGANGLQINGGSHTIFPSMSLKKLQKYDMVPGGETDE